MATYRIVCTDQEPVYEPKSHAHIVSVGTGVNPDKATEKFTLAEVIAKIGAGDVFYTQGPNTGKQARVVVAWCTICSNRQIIKSSPDATTDNNLDGGIRRCKWSN